MRKLKNCSGGLGLQELIKISAVIAVLAIITAFIFQQPETEETAMEQIEETGEVQMVDTGGFKLPDAAEMTKEQIAVSKARQIVEAAKAMQSGAASELVSISDLNTINNDLKLGVNLEGDQTVMLDVDEESAAATISWGDKAICVDQNGKPCCSTGDCEGLPICGE